ncbi:type II secretion system F family protein [Roseovarius nitratireducens]|uniref:type II secretion system F family protein n=1 Tax=Roseovarius nitratireducens TaxID=2044597 RepID=UPI000CE2122E|nr:type II secretion system F family protein [Roseovarius nitratireducens]
MLQFDLTVLIVPLAALAAVGLLLAVAMPWVRARERNQRRMALAVGDGQGASRPSRPDGQTSTRRKAIEKTLKEINERQSARWTRRNRPDLEQRLREAGLTWTPRFYRMLSAAIAAGAFAASLALGPLFAGAIALVAGLAVPHFYVALVRRRRLAAFAAGFPDAIDVIVRGVRAGRPLADCLAVVAADTEDPIRTEFRLVVEDQSVGLPIQEAVERLAQRVPLQEVGFLAIVVAIQNRAGGSLTEALGNLSTVLRGRRQLHAKVKAMSAEAKTSAGIIGSLPVIVASLVQLTSPEYLAVLYQTDLGLMVVAACAVWMSIGVFVMRQMINFDM